MLKRRRDTRLKIVQYSPKMHKFNRPLISTLIDAALMAVSEALKKRTNLRRRPPRD